MTSENTTTTKIIIWTIILFLMSPAFYLMYRFIPVAHSITNKALSIINAYVEVRISEEKESTGAPSGSRGERAVGDTPTLATGNTAILAFTIASAIMLAGFLWQMDLVNKDEGFPARVYPAAFLGILVTAIAAAVWGIAIVINFNRRDLPLVSVAAFGDMLRVIVFSCSLFFKSYLAALTLAIVVGCTVWSLLVYGKFLPIPIIQGVFDWTFSTLPLPRWASWFYTCAVAFYSLAAALQGSFAAALHGTVDSIDIPDF